MPVAVRPFDLLVPQCPLYPICPTHTHLADRLLLNLLDRYSQCHATQMGQIPATFHRPRFGCLNLTLLIPHLLRQNFTPVGWTGPHLMPLIPRCIIVPPYLPFTTDWTIVDFVDYRVVDSPCHPTIWVIWLLIVGGLVLVWDFCLLTPFYPIVLVILPTPIDPSLGWTGGWDDPLQW